jgi:hypothetical protein
MRKVLITESSLRDLLRELMNSHAPIFPNPVVDPQAAETDPTNQNFVPSDKVELMSALRALVDQVDDERIPQVYVTVKDAIEKEEAEMKKETKVEQIIRQQVRKMLIEADLPPVKKIPFGVSGLPRGANSPKVASLRKDLEKMQLDDPEETLRGDEPAQGRQRKNVMMSDGTSFKDIAKELGFAAESGAKQAVEKAMQKAKFVGSMDQDDLEILVLQSMSEYIDILKNTGEISNEEVSLLKNNPGIVRELDGFREFLNNAVKSARKESENVED